MHISMKYSIYKEVFFLCFETSMHLFINICTASEFGDIHIPVKQFLTGVSHLSFLSF